MVAAKAAIATTGHNISNANTEGFSRQRVDTAASEPQAAMGSHAYIGSGTEINRVERINDEYLEKQIRTGQRDLSNFEEKDLALKQTEDIFNEMNGDGLNRLVSKFFNEFRKLANEPDNEGIRQSVRESSRAMVNDFHRLHGEIQDVRRHIDTRIEGYTREVNTLANEVKDLNQKIKVIEVTGGSPNDLLDKRDVALKKLSSMMDIQTFKDKDGAVSVNVRGVGPLVSGPEAERFTVLSTPADDQGKIEGALDLKASSSAHGVVTHQVMGGKLGALIEVRDKTLSAVLSRLDDLAATLSESVNAIHTQGFTRNGEQGVAFFKPLTGKDRASEFIELSDAIHENINNIASAAVADAPGDNRIAIAISGLQSHHLMNEGRSTLDDFYNSIVTDVAVAAQKAKSGINQQKDIMTQLGKIRDQISGVSIDEETANLMQFQHTFDASAKVIQVADEMLKTVLELKR
jgi:flagellar hook-associated protein 1 FlgK